MNSIYVSLIEAECYYEMTITLGHNVLHAVTQEVARGAENVEMDKTVDVCFYIYIYHSVISNNEWV